MFQNANIQNLSLLEQKKYYEKLREQCLFIRDNQFRFGQNIIKNVYPFLRQYKLEIQGEENVPNDSNALFLVNHSNSHDIFTAYEVLSCLKRRASVMVATDCLNSITTGIFNISNATLLDRRKKEDREKSVLALSKKILSGNDGVIFGESTWNLHPILPMHNIRKGATTISAITQVPIIPTIFEYIEEDGILKTEGQLYRKCFIRFGKPVMINYDENFIAQSNMIREEMIKIRRQIWGDYSIRRDCIGDIDPLIYINHTYLKKFKALGFTYDSGKEQEYLLFLENEKNENEYTIDVNGNFLPGITEKNFELSKILRK